MQETCPKCGSRKVKITTRRKYLLACLYTAILCLGLGFILLPLLLGVPIAGIMAIVYAISGGTGKCLECKNNWRCNKPKG